MGNPTHFSPLNAHSHSGVFLQDGRVSWFFLHDDRAMLFFPLFNLIILVLGPILFLIYISDIGQDLIASTLVYVDDTKVNQRVTSEQDIEALQEELIKLDSWAKENNMDFNKGKFVVMRYGQNESLKNETEYFSGNYEEIIERKDSVRDLGVQLTDNGAFEEHIDKVCKKVRQKSGWLFRTFYSRNTLFLRQLFKSLVQPHIDYCSQLWAPLESQIWTN